ncbi:MAG TPA: hypothetical protein VJ976_06590 [Ornithinimicrobium sp.]|uniref:hypothetical protein n=1 Tax=Ornithinimicrobium sp. TaxID=1977084 RepID=UPI002B45B1BC|nr:hypothetical protein [Ornithinimicrobium sp.]HKJ12042.1 hypothetical protein [Ornithinimicrobium sp.]
MAEDGEPLGAGPSVRRRQIANALNLSTVLGLGLAGLGGARLTQGPGGLLLAERYRWSFPTGAAFTVGDVVITSSTFSSLLSRHPDLLRHEEHHAQQWMRCLGLPFLPLYLASMGWSWLRTGDRASRCVFERQAGLARGGYVESPTRPLGPVLARGLRRLQLPLRGRGPRRARPA